MLRLDRFLAETGVGTRSEVKKLIAWGKVTVDGKVCRDPSAHIAETAEVMCRGVREVYRKYVTVAMNKPAGVLSATEDGKGAVVTDLLTGRYASFGLKPAGRLDKDVTGLLLLTNNGDLVHGIISPNRGVKKRYSARLSLPLPADAAERVAAGLTLADGMQCLPAELIYEQGALSAEIIVQEGKFHQVKRMFEALGSHVDALKRLSVGPILLGDLPEGSFRELTQQELSDLAACAGLSESQMG